MYYIKILLVMVLEIVGCFAADLDTGETNHPNATSNIPSTGKIDIDEPTLHPDTVTDAPDFDLGPIVETIVILSEEDFFKEEKKFHRIQAQNLEQLRLLKDYPLGRSLFETHTREYKGNYNEQHIHKKMNQLSPIKCNSEPFSIWSFLFSWIDF